MKIEKISFSKNTVILDFDSEIKNATFLKDGCFGHIILNDMEIVIKKSEDNCKAEMRIESTFEPGPYMQIDADVNKLREAINKLENEL